MKKAMQLMMVDTCVRLTDKEAQYCFGMSQWTCIDVVKHSAVLNKYNCLEFLEFMELIGRVAHISFMNSEQADLDLYEKMIFVLDEWLELVGEKREEAQPFEEGCYESSDQSEHEEPILKRLKQQKLD